jgi:hypothetical protein
MTEKQYNKLITNIINAADKAELKGITEEEITSRYNDILAEHGEEKADQALQYTLKQFREQASKREKEFWQAVKNETFSKKSFCPCAISELKRMIKAGEIDIAGYTQEQAIKQKLNIA